MPTKRADIAVIIPALNECENLNLLLPALKRVLGGLDLVAEVIVIDGGSGDFTREVAAHWGARVITQREPGYGGALIAGFKAATTPFVVTMDADLTHSPVFLRDFWQHRDRAEVIIASRYVHGGTAEMSKFRLMLSRILNYSYSRILALPIHDLSSGFRLYHRTALSELVLQARDFDIQEEILVRAYVKGRRVYEIPFGYKPRGSGNSHIRLLKFGWSFLKTLKRMRDLRFSEKWSDQKVALGAGQPSRSLHHIPKQSDSQYAHSN